MRKCIEAYEITKLWWELLFLFALNNGQWNDEFKDKGLEKGNQLPAMASPSQEALAKPQTMLQ